jgi:hypothetical protein
MCMVIESQMFCTVAIQNGLSMSAYCTPFCNECIVLIKAAFENTWK